MTAKLRARMSASLAIWAMALMFLPAGAAAQGSVRCPTLTWMAVSGATWYQVWINRAGEKYYEKWLQQTETTWTADFDFRSGDYTWWVRPWGETIGYGPWSAAGSFSVQGMAPGITTLIAPSGSSPTDPPRFSWNAAPDCSWYYLWVDKGGEKYFAVWIQGATDYTPSFVFPYGKYRWWIRTWNVDGYGPWSAPTDFEVGLATPLSPLGDVAGPVATFSWDRTACPDATWFYLQVDRGNTNYMEEWVTRDLTSWGDDNRSYYPLVMPTNTYSWRVRAWSPASGYGAWSSQTVFRVCAALSSTNSVVDEILSYGESAKTVYTSPPNLLNTPVVTGTVTIVAGTFHFRDDDGDGVLEGNAGGVNGSIDYNTGAWLFDLKSQTIADGTVVRVSYRYVAQGAPAIKDFVPDETLFYAESWKTTYASPPNLANTPVVRGSVAIIAGGFVFRDEDGDGVLEGSAGGADGSIEYDTGAWAIDLKGQLVADGERGHASYQYLRKVP